MLNQIAAEITTIVAPFAPFLIEAGKEIAEKAGDATWKQAQHLWKKFFSTDEAKSKLTPALQLVSTDTKDPTYRAALAKVLLEYLKQHPKLSDEIAAALKSDTRIQEVLASEKGSVEAVKLTMTGHGRQRVEARGGKIKNVKLDMD